MKTQNLNSLNGLEATELTHGQMEVITGGNSKAPKSKPAAVFGLNVGAGKSVGKPKPKK